jgi:mRNA interferase RelE/StbE
VGSYKSLIKPSAVKEIEAIPLRDRRRIVARIQELSSNPRPPGSEKLSGQDKFCLRQGAYRIVYSVKDDEASLLIVKVRHRKEVYRQRRNW